eukprot:scaffold13845_cov42-Cyclotella_meneghiniana.AAC.1
MGIRSQANYQKTERGCRTDVQVVACSTEHYRLRYGVLKGKWKSFTGNFGIERRCGFEEYAVSRQPEVRSENQN